MIFLRSVEVVLYLSGNRFNSTYSKAAYLYFALFVRLAFFNYINRTETGPGNMYPYTRHRLPHLPSIRLLLQDRNYILRVLVHLHKYHYSKPATRFKQTVDLLPYKVLSADMVKNTI
jgi:hypothetical protein